MNINGIVPSEKKKDTKASPAASVVSFPYAAGTTIAFNPIGIETIHIAHLKNVEAKKLFCGNNININNKTNGYTNNRIIVVIFHYTFPFFITISPFTLLKVFVNF